MKVLQTVRSLGIMVLGIVLFLVVLQLVQIPMHRARMSDLAAAPILLLVMLAAYVAIARFIERRTPAELRIRALPRDGFLGLAIGFVLFAATIEVLALSHVYRAHAAGVWSGAAPALAMAFVAAFSEELLFRGFLFRTVRDLFGTWTGLAVSAVVFGSAHAFNPGASVASTVAIALEAGVLLSLAYAVTDALWLPIGLHAGWNFTEAFIFGTSVSGHATTPAILQGTLRGPTILTGGAFGPEASIVAVIVCLAASVAFAAVLRNQAVRVRQRGLTAI